MNQRHITSSQTTTFLRRTAAKATVPCICLNVLYMSVHVEKLAHLNCKSFKSKSVQPGPEVKKLSSCSTQLSTHFIVLIKVKMPTIVCILTFISMINTTNACNFFKCRHFSFYEQLKCCAQLSRALKKFYNLGARKCHNHTLQTNRWCL